MRFRGNRAFVAALSFILLLLCPASARAHFGMIIPSTDIVDEEGKADVHFRLMFAHPFEGKTMDMARPVQFGVMVNGGKQDLSAGLAPYAVRMYEDESAHQAWQADYALKRPGDHIFYMEPAPYWEPAEDLFIIHYTKVIVDGFGKEDAWDQDAGLKTEIVPLTRPYGIYAGNVFRGVVKLNGEAVPFSEVEVEYYNENGSYTAPRGAFVTQTVRCDRNGVFAYAMPRAGWWGFAALNEDDATIKHDGADKPVEIGAVLWVNASDMK